MAVPNEVKKKPGLEGLYQIAAAQEEHFTTSHAAERSYYPAFLGKYLGSGDDHVDTPRNLSDRSLHHEGQTDPVVMWQWKGSAGVFSYETAAALP